MSSAFDDLFADTSVAALQAVHGVSVIYWPCGVSGNAVTVAGCLWTPDETPRRSADMDGEEIIHGGVLQSPEATAVEGDGVWVIDGVCYSTVAISDVHAGLRTLALQRNDKLTTSRHRGGLL